MHGSILAREHRRWLVQVVGQANHGLRVVGARPVGVACLRSRKDTPRESESRSCEDGWARGNKLLVEKCNLSNVKRHVLNLGIVWGLG